MKITVAHATRDKQVELPLELDSDATVEQALEVSGIYLLFPEIDQANLQVGIFSKRATLADPLSEGDRVEIYRPLQVDPKEARRLRAEKRRV